MYFLIRLSGLTLTWVSCQGYAGSLRRNFSVLPPIQRVKTELPAAESQREKSISIEGKVEECGINQEQARGQHTETSFVGLEKLRLGIETCSEEGAHRCTHISYSLRPGSPRGIGSRVSAQNFSQQASLSRVSAMCQAEISCQGW